ncbi:hypothetical protein SAY87_000340 [Trapa incisa]|uniref:Uncharacterized protein n=1 Tax=Trapa incisa TaxID=236973 RepID=A0AAN7GID7_9MYRT|nr:hypothetical protein SAY87_000340 [Trapa incisa]
MLQIHGKRKLTMARQLTTMTPSYFFKYSKRKKRINELYLKTFCSKMISVTSVVEVGESVEIFVVVTFAQEIRPCRHRGGGSVGAMRKDLRTDASPLLRRLKARGGKGWQRLPRVPPVG